MDKALYADFLARGPYKDNSEIHLTLEELAEEFTESEEFPV